MTRDELIEMLNILLDNAEIGCADITVIKHVSFDSFKFVIEKTINALSQEPCEDAEQIDYHDDFATALKKINDYEMTRDERAAISILNAYKVGYESGMGDLEQEPCDDAISRQASIDALKKHFSDDDGIDTECGAYWHHADVIEVLQGMPPVTPKPTECDDAISRELEIKKLKEQPAKVYIDKTDYQRGYIDGVNQMVKELKAEQEPCDVISREEALNGVDAMYNNSWDIRQFKENVDLMLSKLSSSFVHNLGKWIIKYDSTSYVKTIPRRWAECSCCKWSMSPGYVDSYNFCPNCGAKMVESPQESEEE